VAPYPWEQDTAAAERAGLRTRSIGESARDTLAWLRAGGSDNAANPRTGKAGLDPDREKQLLEAWAARQG
jgi:2'-hydroxyisoflavone reductase